VLFGALKKGYSLAGLDAALEDLLSVFELDLLSELEEADSPELLSELPESPSPALTFFFFPDLKSVSYHPPPFKRNPAADILLRKAFCSHCGHSTSSASPSF
jgi:hypothetical protein